MATYISVAELRAHLGGAAGVDDAVLTDYIDALEAEIDVRFGALAPVVKYLSPPSSTRLLLLPRRVRAVVSLRETSSPDAAFDVLLDPSDYRVVSPYMVERSSGGPHPSMYWSVYGVEATFLPLDDSAQRKQAIADVAKLEAATLGIGATLGQSIRIGDYSETSGGSGGSGGIDVVETAKGREAILRRLRHRKLVLA